MDTVGIRELKGNLGRYLKRVKAGEKIVVTDRKQQITVILPLPDDSNKERLYYILKAYLASPDLRHQDATVRFLEICGSWKDTRDAGKIISEIKRGRQAVRQIA